MKIFRILCLSGALLAACNQLSAAESDAALKNILTGKAGTSIKVNAELIHAPVALKRFYQQRNYQTAWFPDDGHSQLTSLMIAIDASAEQGLNPDDYHRQALIKLMKGNDQVTTDLLASDAYLTLAAHTLGGRLNPLTFEPDWTAAKRERDLAKHLQTALDTKTVTSSFQELEPDAPGYAVLRNALALYRKAAEAGDWEPIPAGKSLKPGDSGPRVIALRQRLKATDLLPEDDSTQPELFDVALEKAVVNFQRRIGIKADGIVGPVTLRHLNVPAKARVEQLRANLERWRWLPENFGARHVRVNIADFSLEARNMGHIERRHDVIVGRDYRMTPVFSSNIAYVIFNPWWETPPNLARQDKLPAFKANPEMVRKLGFEVLDNSGKLLNPDNIRWSNYDAASFPYRLRQRPGPLNALGQVKIIFPNAHNVYLHDTPTRELFAQSERALSSGCVRVHDPLSLAEWVLSDTPGWTRDHIDAVVATGKETRVNLTARVPVHILYFTAVSSPDGALRFVNDVYARDERLITALSVH